MTVKECDICCLPIKKPTARTKTSIKCPKCEYEACINCYITYMKQLAIEESCNPKCMKCLTVWDYSFIIANIPDKFRKEFAKLQSEVLFSLVSSLIPTYTDKLFHLYKLDKLINKKMTINDLREVHNILLHHPELVYGQESSRRSRYASNIMIYLKHTNTLQYIITRKGRNKNCEFAKILNDFMMYRLKSLFGYEWGRYTGLDIYTSSGTKPITGNKKCIVDNCLGYLNNWVCSICHTKVCHKCETISNQDHKCKKEDLDNIRLIRNDCIACPRCATYINRIEGCAQMWCTHCNTPFDWLTGKIVDIKNFHNPHYIEYIREKRKENPNFQVGNNQGNDNEFLCNDELTTKGSGVYFGTEIREMLSDIFNDDFRKCTTKYGTLKHDYTIDYIMKYLNKEITLDRFKKLIQMQDKKMKYMAEIIDINNVFKMKSIAVYNYHINRIVDIENKCDDPSKDIDEYCLELYPELRPDLTFDFDEYDIVDATINKEMELLTQKIFDLVDESNKYRTEISNIYKYSTNLISYDIKEKYRSDREMSIRLRLDKKLEHTPIKYEHYHFNTLIPGVQDLLPDTNKNYICERCLEIVIIVPIYENYSNTPSNDYVLVKKDNTSFITNNIPIILRSKIEKSRYPTIETTINDKLCFLYNGHRCKYGDRKYLYIEKLKNIYFKDYKHQNDNVV